MKMPFDLNLQMMNKSLRQRILKIVYPVWMKLTQLTGMNMNVVQNKNGSEPAVPFHSLSAVLNSSKSLAFEELKGKKVLLVNTASNCGYTDQYAELQKLYEQYKDQLVVIGFPANDFKEQEKGSDEEIAAFCQVNYGVSFPLVKKSTVVRSAEQNKVFEWLTDKAKNGWNDTVPSWNFSKYLVNEQGVLTHYFDPSISPLSTEVIDAVRASH
jgi:glutathione peroxidase